MYLWKIAEIFTKYVQKLKHENFRKIRIFEFNTLDFFLIQFLWAKEIRLTLLKYLQNMYEFLKKSICKRFPYLSNNSGNIYMPENLEICSNIGKYF